MNVAQIMSGIIAVVLIYIIIGGLWRVAEIIIYGHATPRVIDDVVCLVLAVSLFFNLK